MKKAGGGGGGSKKGFLENFSIFTGKHLSWGLFFTASGNFIKIEFLTQMFPYELCEHFPKNTLFTEHLQWMLL